MGSYRIRVGPKTNGRSLTGDSEPTQGYGEEATRRWRRNRWRPRAEEHRGPLATPGGGREEPSGLPHRAREATSRAAPRSQTSGLQSCGRRNLCCASMTSAVICTAAQKLLRTPDKRPAEQLAVVAPDVQAPAGHTSLLGAHLHCLWLWYLLTFFFFFLIFFNVYSFLRDRDRA